MTEDLALSQLQTSDGRHQIPIERENMPSIADARAPVIIGLALAAILASSAFAADQPPDIKGKWVGRTHTIVAGSGAHLPTNKGTFEKPGLLEKDLVIEVTGQEGRRLFLGNSNLFRQGGANQEPMIGQLTGSDYRTVVIVDTDGYLNGQLVDDNVFSFCYTHAGGKTQSSVVSCSEVKRAL